MTSLNTSLIKHMIDFEDLITFVYPDLLEDPRSFYDRAILSATNATIIGAINTRILDMLLGEPVGFSRSDTLIRDPTKRNATAFASPEHPNK